MRLAYAALPQSMSRMLQYLDERHGGGAAYAVSCGVTDRDLARLRDRRLS